MKKSLLTAGCVLLGSSLGTVYVTEEARGRLESYRGEVLRQEMESMVPGLASALELTVRGRDARLVGRVSAAQQALVQAWAEQINAGAPERGGFLLREMDVGGVEVLAPPASYGFLRDDGKGWLKVTGMVPNARARGNVLAHARESLPKGVALEDLITLDDAVSMPPVPPELPDFLRELWRHSWNGAVRFEGGKWYVSGTVPADADRAAMVSWAEKAGLAGADLSDLRVVAPEFSPYLILKLESGQKPALRIRLSHFDPASRALLATLSDTTLPVGGVLSPQVREAAWIAEAGEFTRHFLRLVNKGEFKISDQTIHLAGEVPDATARLFLLAESRRRFPSMEVTDALVVPPPAEMVLRPLAAIEWRPPPLAIPAGQAGVHIAFAESGGVSVSGQVSDAQSRTQLLATLRAALPPGAEVDDTLKVGKEAPPDITKRVAPLFPLLKRDVRDASLTWIHGHVLLRGRVVAKAKRDELLAALHQALPDMILTDQLQIDPAPSVSPP
ncbi:MAG: hypothetical protein IPK32_10865 [Verrucomicrobiaceae bacterium]|nr:hypothetical protein [Verrucomicrobiaceae bacterium]